MFQKSSSFSPSEISQEVKHAKNMKSSYEAEIYQLKNLLKEQEI